MSRIARKVSESRTNDAFACLLPRGTANGLTDDHFNDDYIETLSQHEMVLRR